MQTIHDYATALAQAAYDRALRYARETEQNENQAYADAQQAYDSMYSHHMTYGREQRRNRPR